MSGAIVQTCPTCQSHRVHRSRARTRIEEMRKYLTGKRPHRCHACGWRGWWDVSATVTAMPPPDVQAPPLDMRVLDR